MNLDLAFRTKAVCEQMSRYSGGVFNQELIDVLECLSDVNDDLYHGRDIEIVRRNIAEVRYRLLLLEIAECDEKEVRR